MSSTNDIFFPSHLCAAYILGLAKTSRNSWEKKMREVDTIFPFQIIWEMLSAFPNFMSFNIGLLYEAWIILSFQSFYHKDVINFTDCVSWILRQWHDFCPLFCWYDTLYLLICICSIILAWLGQIPLDWVQYSFHCASAFPW